MTEKVHPVHGRVASAREHEAGHREAGAPDSEQGYSDEEVDAEVVSEVESPGGGAGAGDEEGVCDKGKEELLERAGIP